MASSILRYVLIKLLTFCMLLGAVLIVVPATAILGRCMRVVLWIRGINIPTIRARKSHTGGKGVSASVAGLRPER